MVPEGPAPAEAKLDGGVSCLNGNGKHCGGLVMSSMKESMVWLVDCDSTLVFFRCCCCYMDGQWARARWLFGALQGKVDIWEGFFCHLRRWGGGGSRSAGFCC